MSDLADIGLSIRIVRSWDPIAFNWNQQMGRLCECGRMYGGIQIDSLPAQDDPDDYDW